MKPVMDTGMVSSKEGEKRESHLNGTEWVQDNDALFFISSYDGIAVKQNEMIYSLPTQGMISKISDGI